MPGDHSTSPASRSLFIWSRRWQGTDVPVTPHKFRHTFARTWLERGGELYSLSRLMGHSSVKVTEIYLEDFQSRQARLQHTRYSPVGRLKLHKTSKRSHKYRHYLQQADDNNE